MAQITYANKEFINENASIPAINKVQDTDLNEIKTVVNGLVSDTYSTDTEQSYSCNYINSINDYSTSETNTGKKWIDGKPIYRKVITGTTSTKDAAFNVAHGISNYGIMMIDNKSFIKSVGTSTFITPINCPPNSSSSYNNRPVRAAIVDNNITIYIGSYNGYNSYEYNIILEYTKTTD